MFPRFLVMPLRKILETFVGFFFFLFQEKIRPHVRPHGRLYGRLCRTRGFCVQRLCGPQYYLSSFQLFQQKRWSRGRFNCTSTFACKGTIRVEVLASSSFPSLKPPFFSFVDPASLWRAESSRSQPVYREQFPHGRHSSKNNFFEIKISQRRDWETPSLPY